MTEWQKGDPVQYEHDSQGNYVGWVRRFSRNPYTGRDEVEVDRPENHFYTTMSRNWWAPAETLIPWEPPS